MSTTMEAAAPDIVPGRATAMSANSARPYLTSTHSKRSMPRNELDGSVHISTHGKLAGVRQVAPPAVITNADEDAQSVTEGSEGEFADPALVLLNDSNDDDDDDGSFCDADETCSADQRFLRRGMSLGPDELEEFIVEFGDEIKEGAYYDDEGDKIAVPMPQPPHVEEMMDEDEDGDKAKEGETKQEGKQEEKAEEVAES